MSRVIAITGGSAGIGRATALRVARDGASVAICARRRDKLDDVAKEIEKAGGTALPIVADVTSEADMNAFVAKTVERFGRLDVMMCNAGFGTYYATRAALPLFRRQKQGHFIIVSSIAGKRGVPYMGAYSATKFAQIGMAECLRAELYGSDIHVSVLCPVSTPTEFTEVMERETGGGVSGSLGPTQSAEEVAETVARAIDKPIPEIYPYFKSRGLVLLNALAPGFTDKLVQQFGRKPRV